MSNLTRLLQTTLAGAEAQNLTDHDVRNLVREIIDDDDREVDTHEAARLLGKSEVTLKRWRCDGKGPRYRKDDGGCVRYRVGWLREHQNKGVVSRA